MSTAIERTLDALCAVTKNLPIGTNLGLLHFLWMQVSGQLLPNRGALFPALQATGLLPESVRRAWAAFRYGAWKIEDLLSGWETYVQEQGHWQAPSYDGYKPVGVDLTADWRPTLWGWLGQHYHKMAGKALPAVVVGIIARIGRVQSQRVALPTRLVRTNPKDPSEVRLQKALVQNVDQVISEDEIPVMDAGFKIDQLQEADLSRYVVRLAKNFTARRNELPPAKSCQRLPELNLLAGALTTYLAATLPVVSTGFWDRHPKPTPGRLRRLLLSTPFPQTDALPEPFRKKDSVCGHLPKGFQARWQAKRAARAG